MSAELLQFIINAAINAFAMSQLFAYNREIVDGGTQNRFWSFMSIYGLISFSYAPLAQIYPTMSFDLAFWSITALSGLVFYVASVAQENQAFINQGEPERIKTLPFNLHENTYFIRTALFLSRYMAYALAALYFVSLAACLSMGAPLYAYISFATYAIDQMYQNDYLPNLLKAPYLYSAILLCLLAMFGVTTPLGIGLSVCMVAFTVVDYVRCYLYGTASPSAQFPMTKPTEQVNIPKALNENFLQTHKTNQTHQGHANMHVTFDHFHQSKHIADRILANAPEVDYQQYVTLFNQCNFKNKAFRDTILNQMAVHDKFTGTPLKTHCESLQLPENTDLVDVQIAYLKREMTYLVDRLTHTAYRDLTHQQVFMLHRYARLLLTNLTQAPVEKQMQGLLSIAMTTGSHCNRAYAQAFTELAREHNLFHNPSLTLQEEAVLAAQAVREEVFRTYYHEVVSILKQENPMFDYLWQDTNDYHTYEDFVSTFGVNFYLMNMTATIGVRTIFDVLNDKYFAVLLKMKHLSFSDYYSKDHLVQQAINPEKKLYPILKRWCLSHHIDIEQLDEDYMPQYTAEDLKVYAELMLLDLNICALETRYEVPKTQPEPESAPTPLKTYQHTYQPTTEPRPAYSARYFQPQTPEHHVEHASNLAQSC